MELMAMVMWTIWHRRSQVKVGSKDFPILQVVPWAPQALSNFKKFNVSLPSQLDGTKNSQAQSRWSTPPRDYFKINFDEATFPELGKAGLWVVIRDWRGNVVASLSEQAPLPFSPDIVEAMATARAFLLLRSSVSNPSSLKEIHKLWSTPSILPKAPFLPLATLSLWLNPP